MIKKILFFFFISTTLHSCSQTNTTEFNFGFEKRSSKEKLPDNWFVWGSGYDLIIDTIVKHSGKNAILIQPQKERPANSFGSIAYMIPAIYEGKEIELKAYVKYSNVKDGPIGLCLRIDGSSGILKFDNMMQKDIRGTSDWTLYSVSLPLPSNAKTIYVGAILAGTGQLWVDDLEVLIDGQDFRKAKQKVIKELKAEMDHEFDKGSKIEPFKPNDEKLNDLKVLGLVWGFLKYYHPSIAAGNYNWDYELFRILPKIIKAKDSNDRDNTLTDWIKSLGDFKETEETTKNSSEIKITPDLDWINNSNLSSALVSELTKIKKAKREEENFYVRLNEYVGNPEFSDEKAYTQIKFSDTGFRLLSLYRYWNIIQYFFPYKNLIEEDWKGVLNEFLPKYINANSDLEYKLATLELIARVHDTHASFWNQDSTLNKYWGEYYSPLILTFIENKAVVTDYYDNERGKKTGLKIGDIITKINNKPVEEIVANKLKETPASNYPTQLRNIAKTLLRSNDSVISIGFNRNGVVETREVKAYLTSKINIYKKSQSNDTCFKFINPSIGYLYLGSIKKAYLPKIMSEIKNTKGLIIDLRCYPSEFVVFSLGDYLMPDSTTFVKFSQGSITSPGLFTLTKSLKVGRKNNDYYKGKVVILINETTQSQAEYTTMAFRVAPNAKVIGSTTAGADGNVSGFNLPSSISTGISGIGVYHPDGRETQRVGIIPDIELRPTIKGIKEGKDELLEAAINIINSK